MILGVKIFHLPYLRHNIFFLFKPLFNAPHWVQFQKNLENRFKEEFRCTDLGPNFSPFTPFWAKQESFLKKRPKIWALLIVYRILTDAKNQKKSNEPNLKKDVPDRRTGWDEFTGPSDRTGGSKRKSNKRAVNEITFIYQRYITAKFIWKNRN